MNICVKFLGNLAKTLEFTFPEEESGEKDERGVVFPGEGLGRMGVLALLVEESSGVRAGEGGFVGHVGEVFRVDGMWGCGEFESGGRG